jgi:hypothetical protein
MTRPLLTQSQKGRRMILAQALATVRAQRTPRVLPDGRTIWVSQVFPASGVTPEMPMASFVEQLPHTTIPAHFHAVNQFQVVVEGQGTLGKRAVHPWTVHYTNGFTGYGPLCAGAAGMAFFTLRNRWDVGGARYFPADQAFMQPAPKRHHLVGPLLLSSAAALQSRQQATCDLVLAQEDDGLRCRWPIRAAARASWGPVSLATRICTAHRDLTPADTRPPTPSMWGHTSVRGASRRISCAAAAGRTRRSPAW